MAFKKKVINEIFGTVLVLSALLSTASAVDCHGKSFHCVNSTHFMICVDLGGGVSKSIDNYLIACPTPTVCQGTNHFECEFPAPSTPSTTLSNAIDETTLPWEEVVVTTTSPPTNTTKEYSEKYLNTESITNAAENKFTTDATVDYSTEIASSIDGIIVTETVPLVKETIQYDPTTGLEHVTQIIITENIATAAAESSISTKSFDEERNNTNQITTDPVSLRFPVAEQAMTNSVNGSVSLDISTNLAEETGNATVINDTRNVTKPNVLEQMTTIPDLLNTKSSFGTATAIDDILTTDKDLLTTNIPVVTESILYDTTALEQIMQTIPENIITSAADSTTETPLVEQKTYTNDKSVNQIPTDNISLGSPATEKTLTNTVNDSVAPDVSSNLSVETRNATVINDTRNVTKPNVLEQVTPIPDSMNTKTSFGTATAIDDALKDDKDLVTTGIPAVTESILYDTTALEQIMQTIPENIITSVTESTTETPLVEQKTDTNDKSVNQIPTDNISLGSPATEKALPNTVNDSVASDVSSNLSVDTINATVINDTRNVTVPNVLEQVTPIPDSMNTKTSFGTATAIDDALKDDKDLVTTGIPAVTESILYDTTALEHLMQTIPENIITSAADSTTETPLVEQKTYTNDKSVNQIPTDNISLGSPATEKALPNTVNDSVASDVSSNLSMETINATVINDTRNVTKPNVLEQVTTIPDSLNTKKSFGTATAIDDALKTDKDLVTTGIPAVTESILYDTTALEQIMQTIPENIITSVAESTTETPLVEQKTDTNDKSVNQIPTDNISLGSPATEKTLTNTVNDSVASDVSSNLSVDTINATVINDTRNVTEPNVLEQVTPIPDSMNTKTSFGTATAIDDALKDDKDLVTTGIPAVTESILYDTTALEQIMQTIPENIITSVTESTTETPLVEQKTDTNDKSVNQIPTDNISLGSPATEKTLTNTVNDSVASDVSSNLSVDTINATVINDTRNVTEPNVLEQVTPIPDSMNTKTSFGTATAIDDALKTDKDLVTTGIPAVTESILYDTTALEQIMQTIPENIITSAAESTTETPLVEQKTYTNDKSVNQILTDNISLGSPATGKALTNTVNDSVASDVSSNLSVKTRNATVINDTRNVTKPNVLEQVTPIPDPMNTKTGFGTATAIDDALKTDTDFLTTDIPAVTKSILYDTTVLEQIMQTIHENIITSVAESTTETPLIEQKTDTNDKSVNEIPTDNISLGSPATEEALTNTVNNSVASDVFSNLSIETINATVINDTRNVTKANVLEHVTTIPDSMNTKTSFGTATAIDDALKTDKDLLRPDIPVVTESILYDSTALELIMQTIPENIVTSTASSTETPLVEQKSYTNNKAVNEITTDNISSGFPTTEKTLTNTVNVSVASDVSSSLSIETRNETVINDTRNVRKPNVLEQVTPILDSLNTKTSFGIRTAIDEILITDKNLLTTDKPVESESILYTIASEQIMQTIPENIVTGAAESITETPLIEQKTYTNDKSVNQIPTDNVSLGSPATGKALTNTVNDSVASDVSSNFSIETRNATVINDTRSITKPNVLEQVTTIPDSLNTKSSFGTATAIDDALKTDKDLLSTGIPAVTESILYDTTALEQIMQTIPEKIITSVAESKKDLHNKSITSNINLESPTTEQAITVKLNETVSSDESTNMAPETRNPVVEDETRNVTMTNLLSQATSPPDSLIAEASTGTEFSSTIDYMLTTDNYRSKTDVLVSTVDGVQNGENKNMSDQATITESINVENSVGTEPKIITILEKNVMTHASVSSTTEQTLATESNQLPTITDTVLTHVSVIPKYVKVKVVPTTTKPIVEANIGIDQLMSISLEEHFPNEVYDISTTQVPLALVPNTIALGTDAADQVSSKWTGDHTSTKKANNIINDLTISVKNNLPTESTIAFTINKTEMSTKKQVVSTIVKSIEISSITQLKPTITETSLLTDATFDTPTKKLAIVRTDDAIARTSINTEQPITTTFQETGTEDNTFLTTTLAINNENEKGTTEKYIESVVAPTIPFNDELRGLEMIVAQNLTKDVPAHSERPIRVTSDLTSSVETSNKNKINDVAVIAGIQMTSSNVTEELKNTYGHTTIAPSSLITTQAASKEGDKKKNNQSSILESSKHEPLKETTLPTSSIVEFTSDKINLDTNFNFSKISYVSSAEVKTSLNDVNEEQIKEKLVKDSITTAKNIEYLLENTNGIMINQNLLHQATKNNQSVVENSVLREQTTESNIKVTETLFYEKASTGSYNIDNVINAQFENHEVSTTKQNNIVQPENIDQPGEIRTLTIQSDDNTEITFNSNKLNDSIQGSALNVTRQNSQKNKNVSPISILNTTENTSDVIKTKDVNIAKNLSSSLNTKDAQYIKLSTENYIEASADNIQDTKKYPKLYIKDNHFISEQENTQKAPIEKFEPSTTHDFTNDVMTTSSIFDTNPNSEPDISTLNGLDSSSYLSNKDLMAQQIQITTSMIDNGPTDTLQLAVKNADNIISNPLANTLFDQFNEGSKPNKASVAKHVIKVSTIGKTSPDLVKNSEFESSVSPYVKSDDKIPSTIKDNNGYKEDSVLNSQIDVLQPVELTTDITTEFTVLEAVQTAHEKIGIFDNTLSETTSQFTIGDADHNLIQLEGNIQATEQTTRGNINVKTINHTSFDNPASNIEIMWKGKTNAPKTPELTETSSSYKSIVSEITPPNYNYFITKKTIFTADRGHLTSDLTGTDKLQITTESYKSRMPNPGELRKQENADEIAMDINSVLKTGITLYNNPTEETAKGIVLPSNQQLPETHIKHISVNTKLHITPETGVNQAIKNISESKSEISAITYLKKNLTRVTNLKNVSHSSGTYFNTSSLTHEYTNGGSMQSNLKSEDKIIINNTTPNGIQKQQTIHNVTLSKNGKTSRTSQTVNRVPLGVNSTTVTEPINVSERMNIDAKTSFQNDTNATTNAKGEIVRKFQKPITTEHIINPVISTTQASTKRIHPRPVSSVTENPRKQVPQDPPLNYSCINGIRGRYSDKDDCRKFYICIGNNQPIVGTCPVNTVFSDIKKLCTKNMSHCIRENQFKCPSAGRFSDFINDNVYYICVSHKDHLYRFKFQCQKGFTLNKTTIRCIENKEIESNESVSISSSDNSDDGSSKFRSSSSSSISSSSSGSNSSSNRSSGSSSGDSDSSSSNSSSKNKKNTEKKETKEDPEQEDDDEEVFQCEKEGKFPVRNDCRRYYLCKRTKKSQYRRKIKKCDSGDVFHKSKKKCVDAESYEC